MKKCKECNIDMIEEAELHTDYVGVSFEEQIYLSFTNGKKEVKSLLGNIKEKDNDVTKQVEARICPNCGLVELYVNMKDEDEM